jgi:hypothetical protein
MVFTLYKTIRARHYGIQAHAQLCFVRPSDLALSLGLYPTHIYNYFFLVYCRAPHIHEISISK